MHVTYVLQTTLLIIKADQALPAPLLTDLDRFALVIAAYCHDVDHDGASTACSASRKPAASISDRSSAFCSKHPAGMATH